MTKNIKIISILIIGIVLSIFFIIFSFNKEFHRSKLSAISHVESFHLIDQNGEIFDSNMQLSGRVWVANFIFTTCTDVCPLLSANMAKLSRTFESIKGIKLVSFSVNPEVDTPKVLKDYSYRFNSRDTDWYFLTGKRSDLKSIIVNQFKLGSVEDPIFHSSYFVLVDRNGFIRGYYDGTQQEGINQLFKDASRLYRERS